MSASPVSLPGPIEPWLRRFRWPRWLTASAPLRRPSTDAELVARVTGRARDARASFDQLVERHHQAVYQQLLRLLRDPGAADDVTQDVFVQAWRKLESLRDPTQFLPWVRRIATRSAFNHRRNARTRAAYEDRVPGEAGPSALDDRLGAADAVWRVLGQLSYAYREILVLRYLEELAVEEVAAHLDLGASAAKMRLKRARDEFSTIWVREVQDVVPG